MGEHRRRSTSRFGGRRGWLLAGLALVLVVGVGAAAALTVPSLRHRLGLGRATLAAAPDPPPTLRLGPLADGAPTPSGSGLAAALDKLAGVSQLGTMTGVVLDPATGKTLWSRAPTKAQTPGSTAKLLTAAAALLTLDPVSRLTTQVVAGPTPDSVVLVGGGDPTLSGLPAGKDSVYPDAARLDTLVDLVRAHHPAPIRAVTVDLSRYAGAVLAPGWLPNDVPGGDIAPIQPLMLDGGRGKPDELDPPRTTTPGIDTGKELARRLGADPGSVRTQTAPANARVLAAVSSPPITELVQTALRISDNVLAEALARQVAVAKGEEASFPGAVRAVLSTLTDAGLAPGDTQLKDGSGLSTDDRVPARLLGEIMASAAGGTQPDRADRLRPLLGGLPVAGGDGTLDARFVTGPSAPGRGYVRAKTGTLTGVSSLAGTVVDSDGRLLAFALMSNGTAPADSRPRLDAIAAELRGCGCR